MNFYLYACLIGSWKRFKSVVCTIRIAANTAVIFRFCWMLYGLYCGCVDLLVVIRLSFRVKNVISVGGGEGGVEPNPVNAI